MEPLFIMKTINKLVCITSAVFLTACANNQAPKTPDPNANIVQKVASPCRIIDALITEYDNDFERLRASQTPTKTQIGQIWKAKYHMVGDSCQVWAQGNNSYTYTCRTQVTDKAQANQYFEQAKSATASCLGENWQLSENNRLKDDGKKFEFSRTGTDLVFSSHVVPERKKKKDKEQTWKVFYYIGSFKQQPKH